jgi:hypothetical protein
MKTTIENLAAFMEMSVADLGKRGRQLLADEGGLCHRLGKLISALSSKAPRGTKSVQKYVAETIKAARADIPPVAWSVANCCGFVGEGAGRYSEEQLDKIPARWLAVASAIINLVPDALETGREVNGKPFDQAAADAHLECMAAVIRTKPKGGQDRLETLRDQLKPAKQEAGDGEGGEGDGKGETGEEGEELTAAEMALGALKAAGEYIGEADFSEEQSKALALAFKRLGQIVKLKSGKPGKAAKVAA